MMQLVELRGLKLNKHHEQWDEQIYRTHNILLKFANGRRHRSSFSFFLFFFLSFFCVCFLMNKEIWLEKKDQIALIWIFIVSKLSLFCLLCLGKKTFEWLIFWQQKMLEDWRKRIFNFWVKKVYCVIRNKGYSDMHKLWEKIPWDGLVHDICTKLEHAKVRRSNHIEIKFY